MKRNILIACLLGVTTAVAGCGNLDRVLDPRGAAREASRSASRAAGEEIGRAVGQAVVRHYSPQFMNWYAGYLTRMAFSSQGYSVESATRGYEPGEYTIWAVQDQSGDAPTNRMRRAFLKREDGSKEWWQVVYNDNASDDTIIMESLFSENRERMLRMRAQFPDDQGPQEMPVQEQNYQSPTRLTRESVEGASQGMETVTVPAGRFRAEKIQFSSGGSARQTWWLNDDVPGGVVRYAVSAQDSSQPEDAEQMPTENYVLELQEYGDGASSELGI